MFFSSHIFDINEVCDIFIYISSRHTGIGITYKMRSISMVI